MAGVRRWRVYDPAWCRTSGDCLTFWPDGMDDLSMACYEDGGAMPLCDVGRLTRLDFLTSWDGWPVDGLLRRWRSYSPVWCRSSAIVWLSDQMWDGWPVDGFYEDGGALSLCDIGRLANQPDGMPPCRDAMPRVFSPIGFNINFTGNTWFWIRIYRILRIKEDVFVSEVKVNWRCMSMMVVSWCSASHCGVALPSS